MSMGDVIARLSVQLGLETATFEKGTKRAANNVGKLQAGLEKFAAVAAGAFAASSIVSGVRAFTDASRKAMDAVGGLGEAAAAVGVSTDALQEFRYAATQVGLSTEQMDSVLGQFSKRLGEGLITGKGKFVSGLEEIGLSLDDLKGKTTTEQFGVIAEAMTKVGTEAEKSALLTQFFGKQGQAAATLMAEGADGIKQFADDARKLGLVISEEQIKQADTAADQAAALDRVTQAQRDQILTTPEAIEATLKYEKGMAELELSAAKAAGAVMDWLNDTADARAAFKARVDAFYANVGKSISDAVTSVQRAVANFITVGRDIALGLARGIRNAGAAVWDALKGVVTSGIKRAKDLLGIQSPSRVFMEIGAYIGDGLAIGIEGGTARVAAATKKLTESARRAAEETRDLFARLFPQIEAANNYRADMARIDGSGLSDDAKIAARLRLNREYTGTEGDVPIRTLDEDQAMEVNRGVDAVLEKLDTFGKKSKTVTVNVAKSFKDMANATMQSLSNLANSIKSGGFLGILEAVIGLGLQLGSIGAFGKTIAARINAPKVGTNANGTNHWRGGLSWVGERGPELVNLPRGSQVFNNRDSMGMTSRGSGNTIIINAKDAVLTHQVRKWVAEGVAIATDRGGDLGVARMAYRQSRRVR